MRRIAAMPDMQKRILVMGFIPVSNSGTELRRIFLVEVKKWGTGVRANNIKLV